LISEQNRHCNYTFFQQSKQSTICPEENIMNASKPAAHFAALTLLLGCVVSSSAIAAAKIEKIEPAAPTATMEGGRATVKFTITGSADSRDNCGFWIEYGDGDSPDTRVLNSADGLFPRVMEHSFARPGTYTVKIKGQRVKTTLGCLGEASTVVNVVAPAAAKAGDTKAGAAAVAVAAPSCPDGWQVQAKSVDKKSGAFACGPKMPDKKLECGKGLSYYETAAVVGCRKGK
jgi:hypothetical protein